MSKAERSTIRVHHERGRVPRGRDLDFARARLVPADYRGGHESLVVVGEDLVLGLLGAYALLALLWARTDGPIGRNCLSS